MAIKSGNFTATQTNFAAYSGSMAARIEAELNALLTLDGLPALSMDPTDREVRDRRRLFVAIARGVVKYLEDNTDAITVLRSDGTTVSPAIDVSD